MKYTKTTASAAMSNILLEAIPSILKMRVEEINEKNETEDAKVKALKEFCDATIHVIEDVRDRMSESEFVLGEDGTIYEMAFFKNRFGDDIQEVSEDELR